MSLFYRLDIECRAAFLLTFEIIRLLGLEETECATKDDRNILRLFTPICKLYTAKQVVHKLRLIIISFPAVKLSPTYCIIDCFFKDAVSGY